MADMTAQQMMIDVTNFNVEKDFIYTKPKVNPSGGKSIGILNSKSKGVLLLSGDRHISEFSQTTVEGLPYFLTDFTSSGLTHSYSKFDGEPNQYRKQEVVHDISFGLLRFNFKERNITLEMRGKNNKLQQKMKQTY